MNDGGGTTNCCFKGGRVKNVAFEKFDIVRLQPGSVARRTDKGSDVVAISLQCLHDVRTEMSGRTGYEDFQQQAVGAEVSDAGPVAPNGTATPQSGKTP